LQAENRTQFERIALLLQGGGALGAYQGGVYQGLAEADLHPDWVAGISIGAINSALIAGNAPEKRVERLREFWETVSASPLGIPYFKSVELHSRFLHQLVNQARAANILLFGAPHFFTPRLPPPALWPGGGADKASYYDTTPLRATLERLVDFDRLNAGHMRFSVGAVNVATGNFAYFDSTTHRIRAEHVIASGSLPPGFAASLQHAPAMGARQRTPARHARLPSRSLERARGIAARSDRGRGAAQGDRVFKPHPGGD
jgi:NTE family protein